MIKRYVFGTPLETDAVLNKPAACRDKPPYLGKCENALIYKMDEEDIVYGLGENVRGMNKRGWIYESNCTDDPVHLEETKSLYGAHNFILVSGEKQFGLFLDTPGKVVFDIGYTNSSQLKITLEDGDYELYIIDGGTPDDIITWFRELIGSSYLPPKWAFGFGQSR